MRDRREFIRSAGITSLCALSGLSSCSVGSGRAVTFSDVRKECRQFGLLYFHTCKVLVESLGDELAYPVVQRLLFNLSLDRSDRMRASAVELGLEPSLENFPVVSDIPRVAWDGWSESAGGLRCAYAEVWLGYYESYPWFKRYASLYCDVIDTTNIENFTRTTSHRITSNLLWGDAGCVREYYPSASVRMGDYTYGDRL